ncbi:MAG: CHAT domain-containing protein [Thermoanaerobaculia bacterium]
MKNPALALVLLAALLPETPAVPAVDPQDEILLPGQVLERPIAAGETHVYRVEVADAPLLVSVEQRGIDLVVEARGTAEPGAPASDAPNGRWGPEILLLRAPGGYRIEVRPGGRSVPPGRYAIQVEALPATADGERRAAALRATSRAIQLPAGTSETRRQALAAYREALAAWRSLSDRRWEAETLHAIAALERESDDLPAALEDYGKALELWRDLAEPSREATALRWLGTIHLQKGENGAAREALVASSAFWRSLGERFDEGMTRVELCYLEHETGNLAVALSCYEEVRTIFQQAGDGSQEARMLNNLGGVYDLLGEPDAALERYEQALALRHALGDHLGEAQTLNNIALIHLHRGEWQETLRIYARVREILPSLDDRKQESAWLNNVAFTYMSLGEPERALPFLEDALALRRQIGARWEELITLNNLGEVHRRLGEPKKALEDYRQALNLARAQENPWQEAITRLRLGEAELDLGDPAAALREVEPALQSLREKGLRQGELNVLDLQGRALVLAGRPREALPALREALAGRQALGDRAGAAGTLRNLAAAERSLGSAQEARVHAEAAVAGVEELRTGFVSPSLRAAFLASRHRAYSLLIDLLMDRHAADPGGGHDREALAISEQARARSLLDALHSGAPGQAGSAVPAGLRARRQSLRYRLSVKADQLQQSGRAKAPEREIAALLVELDGVEGEIRRSDPHYAALSQPQPLGLAEIAGLLDPGTLLLEYSLGEERSYLWAVSAEGLRSFILPPQREIEERARQVYEELRTVEAGAGRRPAPADLSRILLGPVWSQAARFHRLVVVPDGALGLLPFGALPVPVPGNGWKDPQGLRPLLEPMEVVYVPSATTLAVERRRLEKRPPAPKWAAVLADPVFTADDPRLAGRPSAAGAQPSTRKEPARGGEELSPLPARWNRLVSSRGEAETIARLAPAGQVWTALGFAANRDAVLSGDLRAYRVIHFATHGIADARTPELSGLMLSSVDATGRPREGFLGLADLYDLDLAADLVVLSACQTGVGKEVRGEGLMGLTRGFLNAGVPRVVASLWKVEDRTTAELMSRFYRALWAQGLSPAAALREAQRSLRRDPRYRAPHSWAGFVLQGDWR